MSIASAITNAQQKVANAYTAVNSKGGTLPSTQNLSNLPTAIGSIPTGGGGGVINTLNVTPTTSAQTIIASGGVDGYSPVNVSAVTSAIDSNIQAGNIKDGVTILGVQGTYTGGGITPTGTISITQNGTYNVTNYASAEVNVSGGGSFVGIPREVVGTTYPTYQIKGYHYTGNYTNVETINFSLPSGTTQLEVYALAYAFYGSYTLESVDLSGITQLNKEGSLLYAFYQAHGNYPNHPLIDVSNITSVTGQHAMDSTFRGTALRNGSLDLSSLQTVNADYALHYTAYATQLLSLDLSSLTTVSGSHAMDNAFAHGTNITTFNALSNLTTVNGESAMEEAFNFCFGTGASIALDLSSLTSVTGKYAMKYAFAQNSTKITSLDLSNLQTVNGEECFSYIFSSATGITGALDLSSLTTLKGKSAFQGAFYYCSGLTSVDLSGLTSITSTTSASTTQDKLFYESFEGCTGLTSVDLSGLTTITAHITDYNLSPFYNAFNGCTNLTTVDFSGLTSLSGFAFYQPFPACPLSSVLFTNLTTIGLNTSSGDNSQFLNCFGGSDGTLSLSFPKLEKIYCTGSSTTYGTFNRCGKVQKFYFPKLDTITYGSGASSTNQKACKGIFSNCSSLTELHFGAANRTAIEATAGYSTAWGRGAGNVTIYFDL